MARLKSQRSELDSPLKNRIIGAILAGKKISEAARLFGQKRTTCQSLWQRYLKSGTTHNRPGRGRKKKLSDRAKRHLKFDAIKNRRMPLARLGQMTIPPVHANTVRTEPASFGLHRRKARRKFFVSREHRLKRLRWARQYKHWTRFHWQHVIWSDECYVYIGDNKGSLYVTRTADEAYDEDCVIPTFNQSSVRVMVWACIADGIRGPLICLDYPGGKGGGMTADRYTDQVLDGPLLDFYSKLKGKRSFMFFQQDNARCHTAKKTINWFRKAGVLTFPHPPSSPDLSPLENLWYLFKTRLRSLPRVPTNIADLKKACLEVWEGITGDDISRFISSMPDRVSSVIASHGGPTRY